MNCDHTKHNKGILTSLCLMFHCLHSNTGCIYHLLEGTRWHYYFVITVSCQELDRDSGWLELIWSHSSSRYDCTVQLSARGQKVSVQIRFLYVTAWISVTGDNTLPTCLHGFQTHTYAEYIVQLCNKLHSPWGYSNEISWNKFW